MSSTRMRLVERRVKEVLLEAAVRAGLSAEEVAEWLYEEHGIRVRPEWRRIRSALMDPSVTAQEFAVFLLDSGVEVDELSWIEAVRRYSVGESVPRIPWPAQGGHTASSEASSAPSRSSRGEKQSDRATGGSSSHLRRGRGRPA